MVWVTTSACYASPDECRQRLEGRNLVGVVLCVGYSFESGNGF
uniref:Uncharacterized protein n=1 Tax=Rhizophora mucronata TaxID=61149 RepID=A0A2P2IQN4_RHIMU